MAAVASPRGRRHTQGNRQQAAHKSAQDPVGDVVTLEEASKLTGVSMTSLLRWIASGRLTAYGVVRLVRVGDVQKVAAEEHAPNPAGPGKTPTARPRPDGPRANPPPTSLGAIFSERSTNA